MKQIDWEQRRYELTKDIFIAYVRANPEKHVWPYVGFALEAADSIKRITKPNIPLIPDVLPLYSRKSQRGCRKFEIKISKYGKV